LTLGILQSWISEDKVKEYLKSVGGAEGITPQKIHYISAIIAGFANAPAGPKPGNAAGNTAAAGNAAGNAAAGPKPANAAANTTAAGNAPKSTNASAAANTSGFTYTAIPAEEKDSIKTKSLDELTAEAAPTNLAITELILNDKRKANLIKDQVNSVLLDKWIGFYKVPLTVNGSPLATAGQKFTALQKKIKELKAALSTAPAGGSGPAARARWAALGGRTTRRASSATRKQNKRRARRSTVRNNKTHRRVGGLRLVRRSRR
jgi:hypothetical protein